jgi:hypothetical protein
MQDTTNPGSTMIQSGALSYYRMQNSQAVFASQQSLIGSWNASSSQFGTTVHLTTLSQPALQQLAQKQLICSLQVKLSSFARFICSNNLVEAYNL